MNQLPRLRGGYVLMKSGKIALLLRLLCLYPALLSWESAGVPWELFLLGIAMAGSLTLLLAWEKVAPFITRHPAVVGADLVITLVIFASSSTPSAYVGYLGATAILIGLFFDALGRWLLVALLSSGFFALTVYQWTMQSGSAPSPTSVIATLVLFVCVAYVGSSLRALQAQVNLSLESARQAAAEAALGQERSRLAREMHDSLVKTLDGIDLQAKALAISGEASQGAEIISHSAQQALDESRSLLAGLHKTSVPPLQRALETTVSELRTRYPMQFELELDGCSELPADVRYAALKITEEALSNAAKHSQANTISCTGQCDESSLRIEVRDDGIGFDKCSSAKEGHMGLTSMRDRAEEQSGRLTVQSQPEAGTTVVLEIPVTRQEDTA